MATASKRVSSDLVTSFDALAMSACHACRPPLCERGGFTSSNKKDPSGAFENDILKEHENSQPPKKVTNKS
jgi:hypothetical protein